MHQVLSYETAVRANSFPEQREYVTKRTCVSLVLTIAFFTLISGYLLGNFVCERKYHIRQIVSSKGIKTENPNMIELSSSQYAKLQEVEVYQKTKDILLASAQTMNRKLQDGEGYILNADIYNKYISCTQDVPPNTKLESSQFIEQLVDNTAARQRECLRQIQLIIDDNLAKG